MTLYIVRRIIVGLSMLLATSVLAFVLLRLIPGDPGSSRRQASGGLTQEQIEAVRSKLGLDKSIPEQYWIWISDAFQGDFGGSYFNDLSVTELLLQRAPPTIELMIAAVVVMLLISLPLAAAAGTWPGSLIDRAVRIATWVGMGFPAFLFAIVMVLVFSVWLGWFPPRGYVPFTDDPIGHLRFVTLPGLVLGLSLAPFVIQLLLASINDVGKADFIRTARGKGLTWSRVVISHIMPNAFLPALQLIGIIIPGLLGGAVVIEYIFGWPGLGAATVDAVRRRDYIVLQAIVLLAAATFIITTLAVDLLSRLIDPRLREVK